MIAECSNKDQAHQAIHYASFHRQPRWMAVIVKQLALQARYLTSTAISSSGHGKMHNVWLGVLDPYIVYN